MRSMSDEHLAEARFRLSHSGCSDAQLAAGGCEVSPSSSATGIPSSRTTSGTACRPRNGAAGAQGARGPPAPSGARRTCVMLSLRSYRCAVVRGSAFTVVGAITRFCPAAGQASRHEPIHGLACFDRPVGLTSHPSVVGSRPAQCTQDRAVAPSIAFLNAAPQHLRRSFSWSARALGSGDGQPGVDERWQERQAGLHAHDSPRLGRAPR